MFVYKLSGCGFEFRCNHLNFSYCTCFEPRVPWHSGKYREQFILKNVCDMIRTHRQIHFSLAFSSAVNRLFTLYTIVGKFNQTIRILWWRFHHLFATVFKLPLNLFASVYLQIYWHPYIKIALQTPYLNWTLRTSVLGS